MTSILVVDDQKALRKNLAFYLKSQGYEVDSAESGEEALDKIKSGYFDIVIADYKMENMSGYDLMLQAKAGQPAIEFIIMTAYVTVPLAIESIRNGAADFLSKPFEYSAILDIIEKIMKRRQTPSVFDGNDYLKIVGQSQKMKDIIDLASKASASDVSILIEGEIGTGKELFARVVHRQSRRYRGEFTVVECAANSEQALEHEIFGSLGDDSMGALGNANGGTLLLRDVDRLGSKIQARLLRYIREGVYTPSDGATLKKSDTRIMASTTRNLKYLVSSGQFREDLYYLLNVMPVYIPPLRARSSDILPLVKHFLAKYRAKSQKNIRVISPDVIAWMASYDWPGNIQEMENIIARACVLASGDVLDESLIFTLPQDRPATEETGGFLSLTLKDNQRSLILKALKQNEGNYSRTASQLGISRTTLWRRLKRFKIDGLPVEQE